jgi:hypothetical protein
VKSNLFLPTSLLAECVTNDSEKRVNKCQLPLVVYGLNKKKNEETGGETRKKKVRVYPAWQMKGPMRNKHKHPQQPQKEGHNQKKKRAKKKPPLEDSEQKAHIRRGAYRQTSARPAAGGPPHPPTTSQAA